jgi:hypothetical protein
MSPAATAPAHEAPPRPLESPLPSASDDEILGLVSPRKSSPRARVANTAPPSRDPDADFFADSAPASGAGPRNAGILPAGFDASAASAATPAELPVEVSAALDAHPDLASAWHDAQSFRETFATPEAAKEGAALLADLNRMDALFFSPRAEDHAELARSIAALDPAAFVSLAEAIAREAAGSRSAGLPRREAGVSPANLTLPLNLPSPSRAPVSAPNPATTPAHRDIPRRTTSAGANSTSAPAAENAASASGLRNAGFQPAGFDSSAAATDAGATNHVQIPTPAQAEFFHATNAAAVESVLEAIESQVERLLPEGVAKSARARVVGEIYRELDTTLRSNRQLTQQMRDAFRGGSLDSDHQRAIVSLVTGRARQALPAVAKRVLNEWTSTIVAANNDRRTRQRTAEHRVDIAGSSGSSSGGTRVASPREINYARMSDADILNL